MSRFVMALHVEGLDELRRELRKQKRAFIEEMATALPEEGAVLMSQANALAPRRSGELVGSSGVTTSVTSARVKVVAAYQDQKAAAVHEGVHWRKHVEGTRGFKWFERAFNAFEVGFLERIAKRLRRLTRGGS